VRVIITGGGTGGHLYPALAIARALVKLNPSVQPYFVGAERGIERQILPTTEFQHTLLDLHPLYRPRPWNNWRTVAGMTSAWRRIGALVRENRPSIVIGTGGYAAGAMLGYAAAHGIPFVLQEQNSFPGKTVVFFSRFAREIYLGFPEAEHVLPARARPRCVDTGNPIAPPPSTRPSRQVARAKWGFPADGGRVILVFGGSQGSQALNAVVDDWVAAGLPNEAYLIWATGTAHFDRHRAKEGDRVRVQPYLSPIADAYAATDLAITRAGAMTIAELAAWRIPAILVPLPTAAADHQTANARALAASGAARWIPQRELTSTTLDGVIRELMLDPSAVDVLANGIGQRARADAADVIAQRILNIADLK
jgi:UDP-N-acetylglucosamine--N-acetylmuramyl-(pentapeptide) pyrophosphoryl-undecaprenol N-acetylglucosamine transferase